VRSKLNPAERTEEEFVGFKRDSILSCHLWRIEFVPEVDREGGRVTELFM